MSYPRFSSISRSFAPGWFAAVMGTGVLSMSTLALSAWWPLLAGPAEVLHWFNVFLFALLAVPWLTLGATTWALLAYLSVLAISLGYCPKLGL